MHRPSDAPQDRYPDCSPRRGAATSTWSGSATASGRRRPAAGLYARGPYTMRHTFATWQEWSRVSGLVVAATSKVAKDPHLVRQSSPQARSSLGPEWGQHPLEMAMRMRGLEPPRGSQGGGGLCRQVAGSGFVTPFPPLPPHGLEGGFGVVWALIRHRRRRTDGGRGGAAVPPLPVSDDQARVNAWSLSPAGATSEPCS